MPRFHGRERRREVLRLLHGAEDSTKEHRADAHGRACALRQGLDTLEKRFEARDTWMQRAMIKQGTLLAECTDKMAVTCEGRAGATETEITKLEHHRTRNTC